MGKEYSDFYLLAAAAITVLVFLRWHLRPDNQFDLMDLVCREGKLNDKKFMRTGAWFVSTWGFYWLVLHDKMTEWYFMGYMVAWAGVAAFDKWQRRAEPKGEQQ